MKFIEVAIGARVNGLSEDVFLFLSRVTPLVNVDLLIQDSTRRTLLTWRSDQFYGPGWHVPGGIIRYKETAADRIRAVAKGELGATVEFDPVPTLVQESILPERRDRAHFISLLYQCRLTSGLDESHRYSPEAPLPDQWLWHKRCPENLIKEQRAYAVYLG
ncbi:MAG: NUDIX hydrolase [Candidatus Contendobacter sp.]|nr:NUDIX hydrolase [Candidatus Contendobacter sp.]